MTISNSTRHARESRHLLQGIIMRRILPLLCLLAISACAVGPSLQSRMSAYIGASSETLVQQLGVPDKQITVNGIQYLAYDRHRTVVSPGFIDGGFGGPFWGGPYWGGPVISTPPTVTDFSCETTFYLKDNHVVNFTLRGNDCSY
jgi:hypothetical protein